MMYGVPLTLSHHVLYPTISFSVGIAVWIIFLVTLFVYKLYVCSDASVCMSGLLICTKLSRHFCLLVVLPVARVCVCVRACVRACVCV